MTTGAVFANFVFKRLAAAEDFSTRLLGFLMGNYRELTTRVFTASGVFDAKIAIAGNSNPNEVALTQAAPADFRGTDGVGDIIGLNASGSEDPTVGQIKVFSIENTLSQTYHLSLKYTERPVGIQINPRNGMPQYTEMAQAIGVSATPNSVVDNGGSLTFVVDSVCESGHTHNGRTAIVYKVALARGAITVAIAIETLVVSWNGVNNRVTTAAVFGQDTPSTTPADYLVVLLGPTVRKADTSSSSGHLYLGTIVGTGSGNTLGSGDNSAQNLIDQSLTTLINYPGGPDWADGTTNPAATIVAQITKAITDLTSTTGLRGLGKLTAPARVSWADATANVAANADAALNKIITDLTSVTGDRGAGKISAAITNLWHDSHPFTAGTLLSQLNSIVEDLSANGAGTDRIDSPVVDNIDTHGGSIKPDFIGVTAGSAKDQIQEILDELAMPKRLAAMAARNYLSVPDVLSSINYTIRDFLAYDRIYPSGYWTWVAIGDTDGGNVHNIVYSTHLGGPWQSGASWAGTPTKTRAITYGEPDNLILMIGDDASGAISQKSAEQGFGAWTSVAITGPTDLSGRAIHFTQQGGTDKYLGGFYQLVSGTGNVVQSCFSPATGAFAPVPSFPATVRSIVTFAENTDLGIIVAGGESTSGNAIAIQSTDGGTLWYTTGGTATAGGIVDMVWNEYAGRFYAINANGKLFTSINGQSWVTTSNGVPVCEFLSVDPYHGTMVLSGTSGAPAYGQIYVAADGHFCDGIDVGNGTIWGNAGKVKWYNGRFVIASGKNLLAGMTAVGGFKVNREIG